VSSLRGQYGPSIGLAGRITPGIKGLFIANFSVYVLQILTQRVGDLPIEPIFGLRPDMVYRGWLFQLVTYMFLHYTGWLFHIVLNMLMLWMFGTEVERAWGTREFVKYYFLCGIGAGIVSCLIFPSTMTIGASGAVFGVMLAYAFMFPRRQIYFWFLFPMEARSFVLLCAGIELFELLNLPDGVAHTAHLGGMLFGYLYLKRAWRLREFLTELRWKLRRRRFKVMHQDDDHYPYH
jgi:membrane associated rhomboid family serine protease